MPQWSLNWVTTTTISFCHELLTVWAKSELYIQLLTVPALLSNAISQYETLLNQNLVKPRLVLTTSIVNWSVCKSAHNTSIIKLCSLRNCKMIRQLLQANRFVPLHHMYVVITTHLAICKIGTVTAGCHRIPIPITDRAKQLWGRNGEDKMRQIPSPMVTVSVVKIFWNLRSNNHVGFHLISMAGSNTVFKKLNSQLKCVFFFILLSVLIAVMKYTKN